MAEQMMQNNAGELVANKAIPVGYKQTEVGVIPKDWQCLKIEEVCHLINGRGFKPFEWGAEGLPIIRIQNLNGSEEYNFYAGSYDSKIEIDKGQLLFAWSGSRGTSFGPHIWHGPKSLLNYHTWKIVIKNDQLESKYFFYALKGLTKSIEDAAHGASALVHTQMGEMKKFWAPVPNNILEQVAISNVLSDTDALIVGLELLVAKKQAIKSATMQQLLTGRTRLPAFALRPDGTPKGYKPSELGEIPEDWELLRLGSCCHITTGKKDVNEGSQNGEYPFFTCSRNYTYSSSFSFDLEAILIAGNGEVGNLHYYNGKFEAYQRTYVLHGFIFGVWFVWYQLEFKLSESLGLGKVRISHMAREHLLVTH